MRVYCDFDGTISTVDTTDHMLTRFADPEWAIVEAEYIEGRMSAAECMRRQISLIRASDEEISREVSTIQMRHGFPDFVAWCAAQGAKLTIISDGVEQFIRPILSRHGLGGLPVISNKMAETLEGWRLDQPWIKASCAGGLGVCKCAAAGKVDAPPAAANEDKFVFVGDGRSDYCLAKHADILFARASLADYADKQGLAYHRYDDFHDVIRALGGRVPAERDSAALEPMHVRRS